MDKFEETILKLIEESRDVATINSVGHIMDVLYEEGRELKYELEHFTSGNTENKKALEKKITDIELALTLFNKLDAEEITSVIVVKTLETLC